MEKWPFLHMTNRRAFFWGGVDASWQSWLGAKGEHVAIGPSVIPRRNGQWSQMIQINCMNGPFMDYR
jgi:hypothetical protein